MFPDAIGTRHRTASSNARIVSLVPSLTELLFDMGLGPQVVGRTSYCIHPRPAVDAIPSVGGTKKINLSKLRALNADYVLLNIDENPKEMVHDLEQLGIETIVTHPKRVADNPALYRLIGDIFGQTERAETLHRQFNDACNELITSAGSYPTRQVLYIIWQEPWMTISSDTYISDMLAQVNMQTITVASDLRYPEFDFSEIDLETIDLVLFSSEPFAFNETHLAEFSQSFPKHTNKALMIDGEMLSWYGSRAIPALRYLNNFAQGVLS